MRAAFALLLALIVPALAAPAPSATVKIPPYERVVLDNGVTLLLMPLHEVPLIAFDVIVRGGVVSDPSGKAGLNALTAGLLEKGAGNRDIFQFADAVADVGGSFSVAPDLENVKVIGQFLARDRALMVELLSDALMRPRFDAQQVTDLRDRNVELIKATKDSDPGTLTPIYGNGYLFGTHPYGRPIGGSEESLAGLTREEVLAHYQGQFGADRLIVSMAGDFEIADMKRRLSKAFGGWRKAGSPLPEASAAERRKGRRVLLVDAPGSVQTYFWIGNVGVGRRFGERAALDLVNTLFGGRFTSMLNTELRIKSGLSYSARARFARELEPGAFAISSFTKTETTAQAIDVTVETLARLEREGVTPDTLASAQSYVLGQYPLALETAANWAGTVSDLEFYGLDRSYIDGYASKVSAVDVASTRKLIDTVYPSTDDLVFVLIGDAAKIRSQVAKYGAVTEMTLQTPNFSPAERGVAAR
jgi:zinc protease